MEASDIQRMSVFSCYQFKNVCAYIVANTNYYYVNFLFLN